MKAESNMMTEAELGRLVVDMHDASKMGFRRISKALKDRGILNVEKDKANRLYWKYRALGDIAVLESEELIELDKIEKEVEKRAEVAKKRNEKQLRIARFLVQEANESFEQRKEFFESKDALLKFAQKILPVINTTLWLRLEEFCSVNKFELADALTEALGSQIDYEKARMESYEEEEYLLDEHLCSCVADWLSEKETEEFERKHVKIVIETNENREYEYFSLN